MRLECLLQWLRDRHQGDDAKQDGARLIRVFQEVTKIISTNIYLLTHKVRSVYCRKQACDPPPFCRGFLKRPFGHNSRWLTGRGNGLKASGPTSKGSSSRRVYARPSTVWPTVHRVHGTPKQTKLKGKTAIPKVGIIYFQTNATRAPPRGSSGVTLPSGLRRLPPA